MRAWLLPTIAFLALAVAVPARAQQRHALVIGNASYVSAPALGNPLRDAEAVATALQDARFEVTTVRDGNLQGLRAAVDDFVRKVDKAGPDAAAVVFYAGHAVQLDGVNYLMPIDAGFKVHADVARQAIALSDILQKLDATKSKTKIVILDACRDNPFLNAATEGPRGLSAVDPDYINTVTRGETGLARIESKGGTLVAFSTSPGATALDGTNGHSPYAAALLQSIREPGLPVEQVFKRVRLSVYDTTNGVQLPWETSSLTANFSFFDGAGSAQASAGGGVKISAADRGERPTRARLSALPAEQAYRVALEWDEPDVYKFFLDAHAQDSRAVTVHRILSLRQDELAWTYATADGSKEALENYVKVYAGSPHVPGALRLLQRARPRVASLGNVCLPGQTPSPRNLDLPQRSEPPVRRARQAEPPRRQANRTRRPPREIDIDEDAIDAPIVYGRPTAVTRPPVQVEVGIGIGGGYRPRPPSHGGYDRPSRGQGPNWLIERESLRGPGSSGQGGGGGNNY